MFPIAAILGTVGSLVSGFFERKHIQQKLKLEIEKAKVTGAIQLKDKIATGDIDWDMVQARGSQTSWKDEWFVILLSIPAILCFIPGWDVYVTKGFISLQQTPDWYKAAFGIAVAASFGFRKFGDFMMKRKNGNG